MSFFEELKRRNVVRVGVAYAVFAWVPLQLFDVIGEILELPAWGGKMILAAHSIAVLPFVDMSPAKDAAYQIAQLYAFRGDRDKVFEWLERAYVQRDGGLPEMLLDPYLRTLSDDPRWTELVSKVGLYDAWSKQQRA